MRRLLEGRPYLGVRPKRQESIQAERNRPVSELDGGFQTTGSAVLTRRHLHVPPEGSRKCSHRFVAGSRGHDSQLVVARKQSFSGSVDSETSQISERRFTYQLPEPVRECGTRDREAAGERRQGPRFLWLAVE